MLTSSSIKAHAVALGFDRCGIAPVGPFPELAFLDEWLRRGYAGTMSYLGTIGQQAPRLRAVEPDARIGDRHRDRLQHRSPARHRRATIPRRAVIARYAWGDDYHVIVRQRLDALARVDAPGARPGPSRRAPTSTPGPIQERVFAQHAGHRLDRQEHLPDQSRARARGCFSGASSPACPSSRTRRDSTSAATAPPASPPARPARSWRRARSTRRAASRISPSSSARRRRRRCGRRWARWSTAATSARTSVPGIVGRCGLGCAGMGAAGRARLRGAAVAMADERRRS